MDVTEEIRDNTIIIHLDGEMDYLSCDELKALVNTAIEKGIGRMILDFENVSYIDSTGIGVLISTRAKTHKTGIELLLVGVQDTVMRVIQLCRLENLYKFSPSLEAALQS